MEGRREEGKCEGSREPPAWAPIIRDAGMLAVLFSVTGIHDSGTNSSVKSIIMRASRATTAGFYNLLQMPIFKKETQEVHTSRVKERRGVPALSIFVSIPNEGFWSMMSA